MWKSHRKSAFNLILCDYQVCACIMPTSAISSFLKAEQSKIITNSITRHYKKATLEWWQIGLFLVQIIELKDHSLQIGNERESTLKELENMRIWWTFLCRSHFVKWLNLENSKVHTLSDDQKNIFFERITFSSTDYIYISF